MLRVPRRHETGYLFIYRATAVWLRAWRDGQRCRAAQPTVEQTGGAELIWTGPQKGRQGGPVVM